MLTQLGDRDGSRGSIILRELFLNIRKVNLSLSVLGASEDLKRSSGQNPRAVGRFSDFIKSRLRGLDASGKVLQATSPYSVERGHFRPNRCRVAVLNGVSQRCQSWSERITKCLVVVTVPVGLHLVQERSRLRHCIRQLNAIVKMDLEIPTQKQACNNRNEYIELG